MSDEPRRGAPRAPVNHGERAFEKSPGKENRTSSPKPNPAESKYAEREDDDGYDPWSDRREDPPLFEPDPWR